MYRNEVRLLISCPDAKGLVAAITGFLAEHRVNILDLDQHTDSHKGWFFARVAFDRNGCDVELDELKRLWSDVAERHGMSWRLHDGRVRRRMALLVSRQTHCCREILWRWQDRQLDCELPLVIGNHDDARSIVEAAGVPFALEPYDKQQEQRILKRLESQRIDLIVLARYMRVLSEDFVNRWPSGIINIHHSFLPAFVGAKPYHQAHDRGVKVIGATCHYVTRDLDAGPIIEQAVIPVNHRDTVDDLVRKGADLERSALVTGVRLHLEDRVLVHGRRTVVFQ